MAMKKLFLAVIALLLTTGAAHADPYTSPQYHGIWCSENNSHDVFRRCREPDSNVYIEVSAYRISVGFGEDMELCGIRRRWLAKNGDAVDVACPKHKFSLEMELRLDARGRLHVKEADRQEFTPPPPKTLPPMQRYEPGHVFELDDADKRALSLYSYDQMPPEKYDFPYDDPLFIQGGYDRDELNQVCPGTGEDPFIVGCADPKYRYTEGRTGCLIRLAREDLIIGAGATLNLVIRHEIGHCNGWRHRHGQ
jgi:hypothetical protein